MQRDQACLLDMLLAARRARRHVARLDRRAFEVDEKAQDAAVLCLIIIGEAAGRIGPHAKESLPQIEWRRIIGMRNILVHDYGGIDLGEVWRTLDEDLPRLIASLETLVPPREEA
jgi:uncharacterized protein with HEPN domain